MHEVPVRVAENLHFHVPGAGDELLEVHLVLPNAAFASRRAAARSSSTMRMPRPPPPQLAFNITGKPTSRASSSVRASSSGSGGVAGITGTPALAARLRAATLLPSRRMVSGSGPMKMMPAAAQASANSGLSDKNPYPG
jgi:hypothetical protein